MLVYKYRVPAVKARPGRDPRTGAIRILPAKPAGFHIVEVTLDGATLTTKRTRRDKTRVKVVTFASEAAARARYVALARKGRFRRGTAEHEAAARRSADKAGQRGSLLLFAELHDKGDPRALDELFASTGDGLSSVAARLHGDQRPAMRALMLDYVDDGCDRPEHAVVVKGLLALAERHADDELMAHLLVAFDRMEKRWLVEDAAGARRLTRSPAIVSDGEEISRRFSVKTRMHLCRRAWRYFRRLAHREPERYLRAIVPALARFEDRDLADAAKLLDAWSLCHALFWGARELRRRSRGVTLDSDRSLADLEPAPLRPELWRDAREHVVALAATARSRTVARAAVLLLEQDHEAWLQHLPYADAKRLLFAAHDATRLFALKYLGSVQDLEKQAVAEWLELLGRASTDSSGPLVAVFRKHVTPRRLGVDDCLELAMSPLADVAELGLSWLRGKLPSEPSAAERRHLLRLVQARAPHVRATAADFLAKLVSSAPAARPEEVRELLDAPDPASREPALGLTDERRFRESPVVLRAMAESPYNDVRDRLLDVLDAPGPTHGEESALSPLDRHLWATTLADIHRGGRAKLKALRSLAAELARSPARAPALLPLLRISVRSVRGPERRHALAALVQVACASEALAGLVRAEFPELALGATDREVVA
ncbi:MAG: hypothetical protein U0271_45540 [Polyangiaceae bacterium]